MTHPIHSADAAEQVQWRNIQKVVIELAAFCFGGPTQDGSIQLSAAYVAIVNSLTAKDGANLKLEPLPRAAAQVGANGVDANDICQLPPDDWFCTRKAGHDGPCAAIQHEPDRELEADDHAAIAVGVARLAAGAPAETPKPVCQGMLTECPTCKNDISKCVGMGQGKHRYAMPLATPAATIGAGEGKDADGERWRFFVANAGHQCKGKTLAEWLASDGVMEYGSRDAAIDAVRNADAAMRSKTSPGEAG